jgi:cytochrome oxidase Cu insertion factor (SCO1/SenC/PrrC family)
MASTPQPSFLARMVSDFGTFDAAHGFAVNLFVVIVLGAIGVGLLVENPAILRWAIVACVVMYVADWVLVEDFGFFGGLGTDPNSMIPMALFTCGGYLAYGHAHETLDQRVTGPSLSAPHAWRQVNPTYALRALAALGAVVVTVLGAAPMAVASLNHQADPIIANAIDGLPDVVDMPAPNFSLVNQAGHVVTLDSLRGKVVALTFLDPVCTADCPVIAQEFRQADGLLGTNRRRVELLAIVANPIDRSRVFTNDFDRQEGLNQMSNWQFLTGSVAQLTATWDHFGVQVSIEPAGAMVAHSDITYVINSNGKTRFINNADPGPGSTYSRSSFSGELASEIEQLLR